MDLAGWNQRYCALEASNDHWNPTPLLVELAEQLDPGDALDVACGTGRNAFYLAEHGWSVMAVDGSEEAIRILADRAADTGLDVGAAVADLEAVQFSFGVSQWDLVVIAFYLQRDLFEPIKQSIKPDGCVLAIVHLATPSQEPARYHAQPGELRNYFSGWEILHEFEGSSGDPAHKRDVAEIIARKP